VLRDVIPLIRRKQQRSHSCLPDVWSVRRTPGNRTRPPPRQLADENLHRIIAVRIIFPSERVQMLCCAAFGM